MNALVVGNRLEESVSLIVVKGDKCRAFVKSEGKTF